MRFIKGREDQGLRDIKTEGYRGFSWKREDGRGAFDG